MADMRGFVKQSSPGVATDGTIAGIRITREQDVQINSREGLIDAWTRDGRVFVANNPVIGSPETMSATGTAITLTAPSLRYTIPSGVTVVPIHVALSIITVAAKDDIFAVLVNNADSFTSGGDAVAMTVKNALVNGTTEQRSTALTNIHYSDTAIIEAGLTTPIILKLQESQGPTAVATWNPEYNILKGDPMVYIKGPASLLVFAVQETTAAEGQFSMSWAELASGLVP